MFRFMHAWLIGNRIGWEILLYLGSLYSQRLLLKAPRKEKDRKEYYVVEPHCCGVDKDNDLVAVSETHVEYHNAFVGQCRQRSLSVTETDGVIRFYFVTKEDLSMWSQLVQ